MAGRGYAAANLTEAQSATPRLVRFVKLEFGSGTQYVHDSLGQITWGGFNWQGVGDLGNIETVKEGEVVSSYEIKMVLSGLPNEGDILDEAINQTYQGDPLTCYAGFLNSSHALVADPEEEWSGEIDQLNVVVGSTNVIELIGESELSRVNKSNGKLFSDAALQDEFAGDLFMQYAPQMDDVELVWGGNTVIFGNDSGSRFGNGPGRGGSFGGFR